MRETIKKSDLITFLKGLPPENDLHCQVDPDDNELSVWFGEATPEIQEKLASWGFEEHDDSYTFDRDNFQVAADWLNRGFEIAEAADPKTLDSFRDEYGDILQLSDRGEGREWYMGDDIDYSFSYPLTILDIIYQYLTKRMEERLAKAVKR